MGMQTAQTSSTGIMGKVIDFYNALQERAGGRAFAKAQQAAGTLYTLPQVLDTRAKNQFLDSTERRYADNTDNIAGIAAGNYQHRMEERIASLAAADLSRATPQELAFVR